MQIYKQKSIYSIGYHKATFLATTLYIMLKCINKRQAETKFSITVQNQTNKKIRSRTRTTKFWSIEASQWNAPLDIIHMAQR